MFNDKSLARAASILANYGGHSFTLMPDGALLVNVAGATAPFAVEGANVQIGASAEEQVAAALEKAAATNPVDKPL